jgi:predicted porin
MKKSLFALAAVTAFAGAAQAQSSVTVYGLIDQSFSGINERVQRTAGVTTSNTAAFGGNGSQSTSRIGFRGTEDMGGGLSAFFTLEVALTPNSPSFIGTTGSANRTSIIGLAQKGIGRAAIGTQTTLVHNAVASTSAGETNNVVGDVIYPNAGATARDTQLTEASGSTFGYVVRTANTLQLTSERLAGFQGSLAYTQNNSDTNQVNTANGYSAGTNNQSGYQVGLNYTWQKLLVTAAYQSFKAEGPNRTSANVAIAPVAWGIGGAAAAGTNTNDTNMVAAATYDFGILKAYAQYLSRKIENTYDTSQYMDRSAQQIGVRAPLTKTIQGWASVGNGSIKSYGAGTPTANFTGYQLGTSYSLSKRTNLYAIFGATGTSGVSSSTAVRSANTNQYAIGARHTF